MWLSDSGIEGGSPEEAGTTYEVDPDFLEFARREQTSLYEPSGKA